jgi:hypothetical protein
MAVPPTVHVFVIWVQTVRPRSPRCVPTVYWPSCCLRRARTTRGGHDREVAQGKRTACETSLPLHHLPHVEFVRRWCEDWSCSGTCSLKQRFAQFARAAHAQTSACSEQRDTNSKQSVMLACMPDEGFKLVRALYAAHERSRRRSRIFCRWRYRTVQKFLVSPLTGQNLLAKAE